MRNNEFNYCGLIFDFYTGLPCMMHFVLPQINRIRSVISLALTEDAKNSMAEWGEMAARNLQNKARDYLTE